MDASTPIPSPSLVVLVGPPASGKSTWAAENFRPEQILCADTLRGIVGEHDLDLDATADAFAIMDQILGMRLGRGLTTVIDTTGLDDDRRDGYLRTAQEHGTSAVVVRFATTATECKRRNRERAHPVPVAVIDTMVRRFKVVAKAIDTESWDLVLSPDPVRVVTKKLASSQPTDRKDTPNASLKFGLHISDFTWIEDKTQMGAELAALAKRAEAAGFESIWLMDHLIQIPQLGREWDAMLEPYTTLAHLAAHTEGCRLGVLVSPVTMRNVGVLAKLVATLDVLSGGRAVAGIGAGSSQAEHLNFAVEFGSPSERLDLLEESLQALHVIWGSGNKRFTGDQIQIGKATGYPRPLQDPMPVIVGGSGEKRTLRLAATYASGCNIFGDLKTIKRRVGLVRTYLEDAERDPAEFEVTHLGNAMVAQDATELSNKIEAARPSNLGPDRFAARANAGTVEDHISGFEAMAAAGVDTAIVSLAGLADEQTMESMRDVINAF